MLTPFALRVISRFVANRSSDAAAIVRLMSRNSRKAEPENFRSCGRVHRTLGLIYLELDLLCGEALDALLTRFHFRRVRGELDITVVRIANKRCPRAPLAVEFVEH